MANDLEHIVPLIYAAGLDLSGWPALLEELIRLLGGHCGSFICRSPDGSGGRCIEFGFDPDALQQFFGYFATKNVLLQRSLGRDVGTIVSDRDILPKEEFRRSEYYNDFLLKLENTNAILAAFLWRDDERFVVFNCNRPPGRPEFEPGQKDMLRPLLPHLGRAIEIALRFGTLENQAARGIALFEGAAQGVLLLNEAGVVTYANPPAERLLAEGDGLAAGPDGLIAATPTLTAALRAAVALAATGTDGGAVTLARPRRGRPLYALASPVAAGTDWLQLGARRVLLLLRDPAERAPLHEQHLRSLFRLTPAEARLAQRLYQGDDLAAAAATLGISRHTARVHLNAILGKTESSRQVELIRRLVAVADLTARQAGGIN